MGDSPTSSQRRRSEDSQDDKATDAVSAQRDDTTVDAGAVQTPNAGPATSACDILRPLSSGSFPVPNSGSLAWLARQQQSQQQIAPPRISVTHEKSLQSDSGSSATVESFEGESPPRAAASAGQQEANQSTSALTSPLPPTKSADEYDGQPQHTISPSPYALIFSEEADPTSPLVLRRYDQHENTNDDPVRKYSESLQLFRRNEDDQDKTWKRRVVEYR